MLATCATSKLRGLGFGQADVLHASLRGKRRASTANCQPLQLHLLYSMTLSAQLPVLACAAAAATVAGTVAAATAAATVAATVATAAAVMTTTVAVATAVAVTTTTAAVVAMAAVVRASLVSADGLQLGYLGLRLAKRAALS